MTDHPDAAGMRAIVAPLKAALDEFDKTSTPYAEESWDAAIPVLEEAEKLVKLVNDQADELNARWQAAINLPTNPATYNAVMEHAAILRGDLPSCVGCARLSTEHRAGCPNG